MTRLISPSSILATSQAAPRKAPTCRVGLVCMPWGSVVRPSLAMSLLKSCLDRHGISSDLHYFNMRLANQLGLRQYEKISYNGSIHAEWLFSQALFGDKGTGELKHRWHQLKANPAAEEFCGHVKSMFENSEDLCAKIAEEGEIRCRGVHLYICPVAGFVVSREGN